MIIIGRELERIMSVAVWHNNIIMLDIVPPPPPPPHTIVMFTGVTAVHMVMTGEGGGEGRGVINNSDDSRLCDLRTDNLVKLDDSQVYLL